MRCNNIYEKLIINLNISLPRMEFLKMCKNTGSTMSGGYKFAIGQDTALQRFSSIRTMEWSGGYLCPLYKFGH